MLQQVSDRKIKSNEISYDKALNMAIAREAYEKACQKESYEKAEKSLRIFIEQAWPIVEPGREFIPNWHIDSICAHLEAVTRGEILRLIINIPPRCSKSTIVSVMWPIWSWLQDPTKRFLSGSHVDSLAIRDALKSRRLIESRWFQVGWRDRFQLAEDQNQKTRYENNKTGQRFTFGMKAGVTGEGGDVLIIDDPHNAKKAMFSQVERQNTLDAFDQELSTRLNHSETSAIVIIMQRLHENDLTGHILKADKEKKWTHLCFPMEYEPEKKCITSLGIQDPREKEAELLCPKRFNTDFLEEQKKRLGIYGIAGQFQQRPVPISGGIINIDWFKYFDILPSERQIIRVCQFWDTAQKSNELLNCPWVCGTWVETMSGLYLIDVYREWMNYPTGKRIVKSLAQKYNPNVIVIEDKSTGSSLIQELRIDTTLPILAFEPDADKVTRLSVESPAIQAGNVLLKEDAPWLADFLYEIGNFPLSEMKDQADMLSMALKYFRTNRFSLDFESTGLENSYNRVMGRY